MESAAGKPYPPLGTLVTAAELRSRGHEVAVYDPMFCRDVDTFREALAGWKPERVAIVADPHSVPVKMCLTSMRQAALRMVALAGEAGAEVLVAGPDPTDHPALYAPAAVVRGEHDQAVVDWVEGREPVSRPRRDLDALPDAAFDSVDLGAYRRRWTARHGPWELNLSTARGCPYRCNWCAKPTWGRSYTVASPERVAAQVNEVRRRYQPDRLWFTDDIFAIKPAWLSRYRALVAPDPLPFRCNTRADLVREGAYVRDLAQSGCVEVWMGAESGSDRVLAAMDKDQTRDDIDTATQRLREHGIRVGFFLQLGYPGESYDDVKNTLDMVRQLRPDEIGVSVSYPLPGTVFHERVKASLGKANWESAMDNELLFSSPYPQAFYDSVREWLRVEHAFISFQPSVSRVGLRRAAALPYHALRWPWHRGRVAWAGRVGWFQTT